MEIRHFHFGRQNSVLSENDVRTLDIGKAPQGGPFWNFLENPKLSLRPRLSVKNNSQVWLKVSSDVFSPFRRHI